MESLSPAKVVLLAVNFASHADIESLDHLRARYSVVLGSELFLRILLTYLPETTAPSAYIDLVRKAGGDGAQQEATPGSIDTTVVNDLTEDQASRKTRKLRLLELSGSELPSAENHDPVTRFLFRRACKLDEEAGMLGHLADLLLPFVEHSPAVRTWMASTILPLTRRNLEYYAEENSYTLSAFQKLPDRAAVHYLLSQTGVSEDNYDLIGRDLRGVLSPWLYDDSRWSFADDSSEQSSEETVSPKVGCAGWEQMLEWLLLQASKSWRVMVQAVEHWDGPRDVVLGDDITLELGESQLQYLDQTFARAILASAYSIPEPTIEALEAAYRIMRKARTLLGLPDASPTQVALENLPETPRSEAAVSSGSKLSATSLRSDLLQTSNRLTDPTETAIDFLTAVILSAHVLTRMGIPCTVKRAGELVLLQDHREQRNELLKLIRLASLHTQNNSDDHWLRVRRDLLWLQSWGASSPDARSDGRGRGILGTIPKHDVEVELLKAMLSQSRYSTAQSLYEDASDIPLPAESVQEAVYQAALDAFDNASNPNRTKGGLKRCNDIIHALPKLAPKSLATTRQIEALLSAAHSLSGYRLVLKQGEPFRPVILRVHSDPVSIIDKVLEQNRGAYTRLQEFLEIGINMVIAGFLARNKAGKPSKATEEQDVAMDEAEKRIVASCISAALREDDFETAYSYIVSRLGGSDQAADDWSWKAALRAGEYVRTSKTQQPTHLGTSSGNPEVRHLEQRLECLATALRVAPAPQLQTILESFRHCEEQLDSAITEEAAKEAAWDTAGDMRGVPGSFDTPSQGDAYPSRNISASVAARQAEETPMSLFDLSRATARVAQRNLTSLSSLHGLAHGGAQAQASEVEDKGEPQRVRRRDQLREAATGTLVSGVGWLIGANVNRNGPDSRVK